MRTLVIPDIHNNVDLADEIIAREVADEVVFLGDYFDNFGDGPKDVAKTALWLKDQLETPGRVCLLGNHDVAYLFMDQRFRCSGWNYAQQTAFNSLRIHYSNWIRLRAAYAVGKNFLLSHASIHPSWVQDLRVRNNRSFEWVAQKALTELRVDGYHPLFGAGRSRGGDLEHGGITWLDWSEFMPLPGVRQIFGHSRAKTVRYTYNGDICLDTNFKHYAIIDGANIIVKEV